MEGASQREGEGTWPPVLSVVPLGLVAAACAGLVLGAQALSPLLAIRFALLSYALAFLAVTGMTLAAGVVAPVLGWRGLVATLGPSAVALLALLRYGEQLPAAVPALVVTGALLLAGGVAGAAVGGRIEHPGHLLAVALVSVLVDTFSVFNSAGPTNAVVGRPEVIAVLALPWPVPGTAELAPVLGVGDVVFAALYLSATRRFGLGLPRTAVALALGLVATMVGVMATGLPLPALVGMGAAVVLAQPRARKLPAKDRGKALVVLAVLFGLWLLLWLRR